MKFATIAIAVLAAVMLLPLAATANPQPFAFSPGTSSISRSCVEQESDPPDCSGAVVTNPTVCVWTVDQQFSDVALGRLSAGTSGSDHLCLISDGVLNYSGEPHWVEVSIFANSPDLTVTLSDSAGQAWTARPSPGASKTWTYALCEPGALLSSYPIIPNSNGGTGVQVDYTVTVANPTAHTTITVVGGGWVIGGTGLEFPTQHPPC
jgi:hypothetical protein